MATMTLKNIPDDLYEQLKERAARHRRSLNSETIVCLEAALRSQVPDPDDMLAMARALRERARKLYVTESELRAAKEEGRP